MYGAALGSVSQEIQIALKKGPKQTTFSVNSGGSAYCYATCVCVTSLAYKSDLYAWLNRKRLNLK